MNSDLYRVLESHGFIGSEKMGLFFDGEINNLERKNEHCFFVSEQIHTKDSMPILAKFGSLTTGELYNYISPDLIHTDDAHKIEQTFTKFTKTLNKYVKKKKLQFPEQILKSEQESIIERIAQAEERTTVSNLAPEKPTILLNQLQEHERLAVIKNALIEQSRNDKQLFLYNDQLALLFRDNRHKTKLKILSKDQFFSYLIENFNWIKLSKSGNPVSFELGDRIARQIFCMPPVDLLEIKGVRTLPYFDSNKVLQYENGYNETEKIFLDTALKLPSYLFKNPIPADALKYNAYILLNLFNDFPFDTESDKLNYLTTLLHPIVRDLYVGPSPLFFINATRPGTGKTLLADISWIIQLGTKPIAMTLPQREEEQSKQITSSFLNGDEIFYYDNLKSSKLDSAVLAKIATQDTWTDRILGANQKVHFNNKACWLFTVNNLSTTTELARRSPRIRLEAKTDFRNQRPLSSFTYPDIKKYVLDSRKEILTAIYTIVQNWINNGAKNPTNERYIESFESWSLTLGGIFESIGLNSFLLNQNEYNQCIDDDGEAIDELFELWWEKFGSISLRAGDLVNNYQISELLIQMLKPKNPMSFVGEVGQFLKSINGQIRGPFKLVLVKDRGAKAGRFYMLNKTLTLSEGGGGS